MGYELLQVSHKMLILAEIISDMLKYMSILSLLAETVTRTLLLTNLKLKRHAARWPS